MMKFLNEIIVSSSIDDLQEESVSHSVGTKKVFLRHIDSISSLTQVAYGTLHGGEHVEYHAHITMEECFFFLSGEGVFFIEDIEILVSKDTFVRVPPNVKHSIKCVSISSLSFFYFGIAI